MKPVFREFPTSAGRLVIGEIPGGFRGGRHEHAGRHHMCVLSGTLVDHAGRSPESFTSGMCRISPSDEVHRIAATCRTRVLLLHSVPPDARELASRGDGRQIASLAALHPFRRMMELLAADTGHEQATLDELAILLANADMQTVEHLRSPAPRWLRAIVARMRDEFRQPLTIDGLCEEVGITRFHATRTFAAVYGCSMSGFLQRLRVEYVQRRLHEETSLSTIALDAGFSDQSHMTRVYRRVLGGTPGVERTRRRGMRVR